MLTRERVRQLVELHKLKNENLPPELLQEAKRLGMDLLDTTITITKNTHTKEKSNGSK